jgi:hypothetical protein
MRAPPEPAAAPARASLDHTDVGGISRFLRRGPDEPSTTSDPVEHEQAPGTSEPEPPVVTAPELEAQRQAEFETASALLTDRKADLPSNVEPQRIGSMLPSAFIDKAMPLIDALLAESGKVLPTAETVEDLTVSLKRLVTSPLGAELDVAPPLRPFHDRVRTVLDEAHRLSTWNALRTYRTRGRFSKALNTIAAGADQLLDLIQHIERVAEADAEAEAEEPTA